MIERLSPTGRLTAPASPTPASDGPVPRASAGLPRAVQQGSALAGAPARMAQEQPPVDTARVAALRAAIAEGRYPVDPDAIADAMLRAERRA